MDAYERSLKLLSMREHSEKELKSKLVQKGVSSSDIDDTIERLKSQGYLSDERFASTFIRSRLRKNPEGKAVLSLRLKEKGCSRDVIEQALEASWDELEYKEPLERAFSKLIKTKSRENTVMTLYKKGFTLREIEEAERSVLRENGE